MLPSWRRAIEDILRPGQPVDGPVVLTGSNAGICLAPSAHRSGHDQRLYSLLNAGLAVAIMFAVVATMLVLGSRTVTSTACCAFPPVLSTTLAPSSKC